VRLGSRNCSCGGIEFAEGWIPVGSDIWEAGAIGGHFGGSIGLRQTEKW